MLACLQQKIPKAVSFLLVFALSTAGLVTQAQADIVTTEALSYQSDIETRKDEVRALVTGDSVRNQLLELGVEPADMEQRIDAMTDQELLEMHEHMDSLAAGQGILELAIGLLVIFMLLDIAGVTDIFPAI